jgi:hypothetical protein
MDLAVILGFVAGVILPLLFANFVPNEKFYNWGYKFGKKGSAAGKKFLGENYEKVENNFTGSFIGFAQGLQDGADSDDE